jgi:hypothetical protein
MYLNSFLLFFLCFEHIFSHRNFFTELHLEKFLGEFAPILKNAPETIPEFTPESEGSRGLARWTDARAIGECKSGDQRRVFGSGNGFPTPWLARDDPLDPSGKPKTGLLA